jgi:hypothetical protein
MNLEILNNIIIIIDYPLERGCDGRVYISDISGKDSIAATAKILQTHSDAIIIPSIVSLACECGERSQIYMAIENIRVAFNRKRARVLSAIVTDVNALWKELVSNRKQDCLKQYGFFTPCVVCHLVFHLIRIRLACLLNVQHVISGERELHQNLEKVNQLSFVLDFYNTIYSLEGITHHQPLRKVADNEEIDHIIQHFNLTYADIKCLFSGNYYDSSKKEIKIDRLALQRYVNNYLAALIRTPLSHAISLRCEVV